MLQFETTWKFVLQMVVIRTPRFGHFHSIIDLSGPGATTLLWTRPSGAGFTIFAYPQRHRGGHLNGQQSCSDGSCWGGNESGNMAMVLTAKRRLSKPTGRS